VGEFLLHMTETKMAAGRKAEANRFTGKFIDPWAFLEVLARQAASSKRQNTGESEEALELILSYNGRSLFENCRPWRGVQPNRELLSEVIVRQTAQCE